jgi:hypothetical protein
MSEVKTAAPAAAKKLNVDSFDFSITFNSKDGIKDCKLNINNTTINHWRIGDEDLVAMASYINGLCDKYCRII